MPDSRARLAYQMISCDVGNIFTYLTKMHNNDRKNLFSGFEHICIKIACISGVVFQMRFDLTFLTHEEVICILLALLAHYYQRLRFIIISKWVEKLFNSFTGIWFFHTLCDTFRNSALSIHLVLQFSCYLTQYILKHSQKPIYLIPWFKIQFNSLRFFVYLRTTKLWTGMSILKIDRIPETSAKYARIIGPKCRKNASLWIKKNWD